MSADAEPEATRLAGRRIVLGVTGGIAAYKAIEVCRRLIDAGAHVAPVLSPGALHFVGKTAFDALASEPAQMSLWDEASPIPHTRLGQSADLILIVPATARIISDMVTGRSFDLLTATYLATRAPTMIAPAMHTEMWEHPAVVDNLARLIERDTHVVPPEEGRLAGGDLGKGRLASPETIVAAVIDVLAPEPADLAGRTVLVTAGGTREPIDPVRFIGNRSSGKQGHGVAERARRRGARTILVTTSSLASDPAIERVQVSTAAEMRAAVHERAASADVVVMAAAVADFRPRQVAATKMKKADGIPVVELEPTEDILAELGAAKPEGQILVGFAAETTDVEDNALAKLQRKRADLLVANDVSKPGVGFEGDTNTVTIFGSDGVRVDVPNSSKISVADRILDEAVKRLNS